MSIQTKFQTGEIRAVLTEESCCTQYTELQTVQKVVQLLKLNYEQAEQLKWSILKEISKEEIASITYRVDETTGQEVIVLLTEKLTAHRNMTWEEGMNEQVYQTTAG